MFAIIKKHPDLDFFIGYFGGPIIPTKQDKFKPLICDELIFEVNGEKQDFSEFDLYTKRKNNNSSKEFEENLRIKIKENLTEQHPYPLEIKLEMIIQIFMNEKRIKRVDVDNLVKSIIDCFNGLVFVDDSQIVSLYANKAIHSLSPVNGLIIGIRILNDQNKSWFEDIRLFNFEYEEK